MALTKKVKRFEASNLEFIWPEDGEVICLTINDGYTETSEWFTIEEARKIIKKIEKAILKREQREAAAAEKESK